MARSSMLLLLLVVVLTCVLLTQDVEAGKKKKWAKKMAKRRVPVILKELENNVTALWKEVKHLGQPVHVHLHGDDHLMDHDHSHHRHHHHYDHHKDINSSHEDDDAKKEDKPSHHHKDHHQHKNHSLASMGDDDDKDSEDMMKMKKMMMKMKKMKYKHHHDHDDEEEEDEDEEGWEEKWMHGGRKGTHVHIHLHTGKEDEEMDSKHHHPSEPDPSQPQEYRYARCDVVANSALRFVERENIKGTFHFRHMMGKPIEIKGSLQGFEVRGDIFHNDKSQDRRHLRGLHGHELGDLSKGCNSLGGHFNPSGVDHGGPDSHAEHRHAGDFGNLEVKKDGSAMASFTDDTASLFGYYSLLGRSLVIHAGPDDMGLGHSASSKASGNAGARSACCVIVASSKPEGIWTSP